MIAASEPLEFVPHGRRALLRHPGSVFKSASTSQSPSENSLLFKLKNVAISDKCSDITLLQNKDEANNEQWFVRQICCSDRKDCTNAVSLPTSKSSSTDTSNSSSKVMETDNPSLKLRNDLSVSIRNELNTGAKKFQGEPDLANIWKSSNVASNPSTKESEVSLGDNRTISDPKVECCYEEELYVKGKTAVWSRGDISNPETKFYDPESRVTIACYTCESPIRHAIFCNFFTSFNNKLINNTLNDLSGAVPLDIDIDEKQKQESHNPIPSICLIDATSIRVFTEKGQDFISSLQFQVKKVWSSKYGILLEKEAAPPCDSSYLHQILTNNKSKSNAWLSKTLGNRSGNTSANQSQTTHNSQPNTSNTFVDNDISLPTCFSLTHPLEEMTPILIKPSQFGSVQYYNDGANQIVFVSESPSIALVFNTKSGLHSLYAIRKTTMDECNFVCSNWNKTATIMSPTENFANSASLLNAVSHHKSVNAGNNKNTEISWLSGISSPYASKHTSTVGSPHHAKSENPMAGMFHKAGLSPHTSIGQASNISMIAPNTRIQPSAHPLYPDICFDHIWTERQLPTSSTGLTNWSSAGKAFLHEDYTGQHYLCYMITCGVQSLLQIARLENPHSPHGDDVKKHLIVGVVTSIPVKDAVVLPSLNLIVVLNPSDNIMLYSGMCFMGKIHIGGVLASLIASPYNQSNVFDSSFPRRSSLIPSTHAKDVPILDDSTLHQLSPVPKQDHKSYNAGIQKLRDAVGNKVTLEYGRGILYRVTLPDITTNSLILKCINALKQILQKDIVMKVISQWYGIRNAPGTQDLCPKVEWSMFLSLMFSLLGYDIAKLPLTKQRDSETTEVVTKKQRTSNYGSEEDWEYLLKSEHHLSLGNSLASMLNLRKQTKTSDAKIMPNGIELNNVVGKISGISRVAADSEDFANVEDSVREPNFNTNSLLFPYTMSIMFAFHLVYEELKMNVLLIDNLEPLARFLYQLSTDLNLPNYTCHYWKDFPSICKLDSDPEQKSQLTEKDLKRLNLPAYFVMDPPSIFKHIYELISRNNKVKYPHLELINDLSRDIIEITELIVDLPKTIIIPIIPGKENSCASSTPQIKSTTPLAVFGKIEECVVLRICEKGYTLKDLRTLPPAIYLFILNTISRCKTSPPVDWTEKEYSLIMREDLALRSKFSKTSIAQPIKNSLDDSFKENMFTKDFDPDGASLVTKQSENEKTGLEHIDTRIMRLRFPDDHRVSELCNMLQSSNPVTISLTQRPEVSDHDFIEEQERYLLALCSRTMALSVGRGMVTLRTIACNITEPLHIPKLCLTGKAPPRNAVIDLSHIEVSPTVSQWPLFHNGVAAGLKLVPQGSNNIESAWVVYNKPKVGNNQDLPTDHAGFLMALGLNGHLKDMALQNVYEYLVKCHEMTSVGLLLGIAATYRGTMDVQTTKLIGIHVEALLPPTSMELDIPQNIQVAALMGVGLLYQKTAHTHMTQVLLSEIGRPPGPEMENSSEREGYSLAAGLALGLVILGHHATAPQFITSSLTHYMLGGKKRSLTGSQKEKYKLPSFQIREGPTVNVDVTAPGATLALGMLYMKSGNNQVAKWLEPPQTHYLLNHCRPDLLLLRVIARGLIIWDSIEPFEEWIENYIPESIKPYCCVRPQEEHYDVDYEAMNQVYCNIVAGACFSIGLRYAGSANQDAKDTLMFYAKKLIMLGSKSIGELAGKATTETCLNLVLLSVAMVMAGTGDLDVMRVCRHQRSKAGPGCMSLSYGSQLAVHAALGLLFLGGGRYTLSTSSEAVAALVCAFFPKFPLHSNDNRYHLQAFRHLYVLAAEPRLLIPRDIFSGKICYANIQVLMLNSREILNLKGPCLLPELEKLQEVRISDDRYWSVVFQKDRNWDQLVSLLENSMCLDIKQRAGCLSYLEDPHGFQSLLAQMLTTERKNVWSTKPSNILAFSNDQNVINLTKHYLYDAVAEIMENDYKNEFSKTNDKSEPAVERICNTCYFYGVTRIFKDSDRRFRRRESSAGTSRDASFNQDSIICACDKNNREERELIQMLTVITYECVVRDTLIILPVWITLVKMLRGLSKNASVNHLWQLKLLLAQISHHNNLYNTRSEGTDSNKHIEPLISNEFAQSMHQRLELILDVWQGKLVKNLKRYIQNAPIIADRTINIKKLASFVTYYDIPRGLLSGSDCFSEEVNVLELYMQKDKWNLSSNTVQKIVDMFMLPNTENTQV